MNERSRRDFLKLLLIGTIGTACSPIIATDAKPSQTTSASTQEPKKTGDGLTPEERTIRLEGSSFWKYVLSQDQKFKDGSWNTTFSMKILNPNIWTPEKFQQLVLTDDQHPITVSLRMGWDIISTVIDTQNGQAGEKWYGEVEFNNIRMITKGSAPTPYSAASTYLKWAGGIQFNFIEKGHSIYENTGFGWMKDMNAFQAWVNRPHKSYSTSLDSLRPTDGSFGATVSLDDKGTHFGTPDFYGGSDVTAIIKRFFIPSEYMRNGCQPGVNCERFTG